MDSTMSVAADWTPARSDLLWMYLRFACMIVIMFSMFILVAQLNGYNIAGKIAKYSVLCMIYCILLVISILLFVADRNFYLPFLGQTVYPCGSLAEKVPANADTTVKIKAAPGANVIYWASEPSSPEKQPISNPWDAYAMYDNSGVVRADSQGNAVLRFRSPSSYQVGLMNRELKRHVHYRVCKMPGMLGEIKTVFV